MEMFYYLVFGGLTVVVSVMELSKSNKDRINTSSAFNSFKNNYLVVYSLMMAGDWLQGPYVYYLYTTYGFSKGEIGHLFIAGFGSSMLFGTIVGSLADKQGRKRACVTYCITYILSCITKHSPQYNVLMLGRVLGGIATSLLFSAFESWLVAEHNKRGFEQQWLSVTFSKAIFLGNGLVAIVAGLFGNLLVDTLALGPHDNFLVHILTILFQFLVPPSKVKGGGISFSGCIQLLGFCTFEACVGLFWPSIMKMRSQYIPEEARSTIMNFFRIPLNIFVCIVLYNVNAFPITIMFGMCSFFLLLASVLQRRLMFLADKTKDWSPVTKVRDIEEEPLNP
ncbi:hypothetical protein QQ045_006298 [Rhodiola kirilowii]